MATSSPLRAEVQKDGRTWRLGTAADVGWIDAGTTVGVAITSAVPASFDAYATVVLPGDRRVGLSGAVCEVLAEWSSAQSWWLGYLDTGADDVVFDDAPRVDVYAWPYVLVEAGPREAAAWRRDSRLAVYSGPDLIFPHDRSWLVSRLWDDDWLCLGGPAGLVERFNADPRLQPFARRVGPLEDATPPGHVAR